MIYKNTILNIVDNCGARKAKCIKLCGKFRWGKSGDLILVVLRNYYNLKKKIKKGLIYLGLIVGVKYWTSRASGFFYRFFSNKVLICNIQFKFLGSKVYRYKGIRFYYKLLSFSCYSL